MTSSSFSLKKKQKNIRPHCQGTVELVLAEKEGKYKHLFNAALFLTIYIVSLLHYVWERNILHTKHNDYFIKYDTLL